jgi:hypothetical protein
LLERGSGRLKRRQESRRARVERSSTKVAKLLVDRWEQLNELGKAAAPRLVHKFGRQPELHFKVF